MRTCYLHLGMPKTGSTAIQDAFYGYEDDSLVYAKLPQKNAGRQLSLVFSRNPDLLPFSKRKKVGNKEVRDKKEVAQERLLSSVEGRKDMIFSSEGILDRLASGEVAEMLSFFREKFDKIVPIIYVRPLASLLPSQFQQRVKTGHGSFTMPSPNYRKRFQPILESDLIERVIFSRFDRKDLVGGNVIKDFSYQIGAKLEAKAIVERNQSLSTEVVSAIYAFNKYTGWNFRPNIRVRFIKEMLAELQGQGETKFGFSSSIIEKHLIEHAADIEWIESMTGFDARGEVTKVTTPVTSEAHLIRIAKNFCLKNKMQFRKCI